MYYKNNYKKPFPNLHCTIPYTKQHKNPKKINLHEFRIYKSLILL